MKIRLDYVSNSSSCSFVIEKRENVRKAADAVISTFNGDDVVPAYADNVNVMLQAKNKNFAEVETRFTGNSEFRMTYEDYRTHEILEKDPEAVGWDSVNMTVGEMIRAFPKNADMVDKMESITFDCDDCEYDAKYVLGLLYAFFDKRGCDPDDSDTEHYFRTNDGSSFISKLLA